MICRSNSSNVWNFIHEKIQVYYWKIHSGGIVNDNPSPLIVQITPNSLDDGPGIRTVLFFKGCPLRCVWCQNPEAQSPDLELAFYPEQCVHCSPCQIHCPNGAIKYDTLPQLVRSQCQLAFNCIKTCPAQVFQCVGQYYPIPELLHIFRGNRSFYTNTRGGITLSGGEPLLFPNYLEDLVAALHHEQFSIVLETAGFFEYTEKVRTIVQQMDYIYFDLKLYDDQLHKQYCGISNRTILQNFERLLTEPWIQIPNHITETNYPPNLHSSKPILIPRIPLIPNITTAESNLRDLANYLVDLHIQRIDLLPYNPLWLSKMSVLGKNSIYAHNKGLTREELTKIRTTFRIFTMERFDMNF